MVRPGEITDRAWREIEPLLPEYGQSGGQWRDHRTVINGILWKLYAPAHPGATSRRDTVPGRDLLLKSFNRWRRDGTWDRLLTHTQTKNDAVGEVEWEVSVDDTVIRAHQHAAGARSKPSAADEKGGS
jgi:transposase